VMSFDSEREAFQAYARSMPHNSTFLVDTYDTMGGVREAIAAGRWLRQQGHELAGVRLDSGDFADLSVAARKLLDDAGFPTAAIVASNDLDEHLIENLKAQGAKVNVWGVGTRLVTAYDQPALGGVYKLGALRRPDGSWAYKIKISEQPVKVPNPGILQVRRYRDAHGFVGDIIHDVENPLGKGAAVDTQDATHRWHPPADATGDDLLVPVVRAGKVVHPTAPLTEVQRHAKAQLAQIPGSMKRFLNPQPYFVGLADEVHQNKLRLIAEARERKEHP